MHHSGMRALLLGTSLVLTGCGVTYHSPTVQTQAAGLDVQVMRITASSVKQANSAPYVPRSLPEAFHAVASGTGLRGAAALPEIPDGPTQTREMITTKLPPQLATQRYRIGIGDEVMLVTKSSASTIEELGGLLNAQTQRQGFTVRDNGMIALPDIGQIAIAGKTLEDAEDAVFQALVAKNIDPAFSLEITEFKSQNVAIGGKVAKAGLVPLSLKPLRLGDALAQAGGIVAEDKDATAIRLYRNGTLYQLPASALRSDAAARNLTLQADDAIYVDESYDLDRALTFYEAQITAIGMKRNARLQALSELRSEISVQRDALDERRATFKARRELGAETRDYVYLAGEVAQQGRVALPYGRQASLADVLYDEGGFDTRTGDPAQIYVIRPGTGSNDTKVTAWHLDATNVVNITLATRMQMRPNDIVFIEEQPITKWSRAFEQAFPILINKSVNGDSGVP
ncbi:polysaccharide biosynthesis/export family protein [Aliiroseovarius sp. F47248L]|uniref:polysaccharide biosynthesis/export family protein n=1 Tax=Aliiroseovarius sp. F47248L TaxID=2926420 RepID=UPI001FF2EC23|nr:polysaccharide biosynthesis/export family protein [Aliiroseovarius sp. F47248L]MCK0139998.1 polysaccharide biosynthesis/export family protein [Aliiroseovarius sp. F47248L]